MPCTQDNRSGRPRRAFHPSALLAAVLTCLLLAPPAQAQTQTPEQTLDAANTLLQSGTATTEQLVDTRAALATLRTSQTAEVQTGTANNRTLQAQLDALGPAPADGTTEPDQIAARRATLTAQLATANIPVQVAQDSVKRADVLIEALDAQVRGRDTAEMLTRDPSPLLPSSWLAAQRDLGPYLAVLATQTNVILSSPVQRERLIGLIPTLAILALIGLALLVLVQPILTRRLQHLAGRSPTPFRRRLFLVLINATLLLVPGLGALALVSMLMVIGPMPYAIRDLPLGCLMATIVLVTANWLGQTVFSPSAPVNRLLQMSDAHALTGLRIARLLGLAVAAEIILEVLFDNYSFDPSTHAVLSLPVVIFAGAMFWRLAGLLYQIGTAAQPPDGFLTLLSRAIKAMVIVALLAALLGYVNLSHQVLFPAILTVADLAVGLFLYTVVLDLLRALLGYGAAPGEDTSLLPVLIFVILALAAVPILALTWGARPSDVSEAWRYLTNGVQFGDLHLSLDSVIILIVVLVVGVLATRWVQHLLRQTVLPRTRLDHGAQSAVLTGVGYVGLILAALAAVSAAGLNLSSLAVVVGALSVGIGLGLQNIVSNFVSGIILLIERPIKEGDWIEVSGYQGTVRKIAVRATRIETFDLHDVIIPNLNLISGPVKNFTLSSKSGRLIIPIGVAYGSDLEKTKAVFLEVMSATEGVKAEPAPFVLFTGMGDSALNFEMRCQVHDETRAALIKSDLLFATYVALTKAGVEIPYPQRDIRLRDIDRLVEAIQSPTPRRPNPPPKDSESPTQLP